eukprot:TRINITY_DN2033_c0_g1_i1.p1 TRINITY_DN2033_c0_g1~~TRINITY_DN2033_c0_g1_i1.p1  ORF type:complete len:210 (-),score=48.70 TRINITY_DN2033_c0_g1_i1:119-748(-)
MCIRDRLYNIPRVVMAENATFQGDEELLRSRGVEVVNLDLPEAKQMMADFIQNNPTLWCEDIGELEGEPCCTPVTEEVRVVRTGGCHCQAVRFEVKLPQWPVAWKCNCSICDMKRNTHIVVPSTDFKLLTDPEALSVYTFGSHTAQHKFCQVCGVVPFYVPRSNPDGFAVTVHCLDSWKDLKLDVRDYDGTDWESSHAATGIANFSKEE